MSPPDPTSNPPESSDPPACPPPPSPGRAALSRRRAAGRAVAASAVARADAFAHHLFRAVDRRALAGHSGAVRQARADLDKASEPEPEPQVTWVPGEGAALLVAKMEALGFESPPEVSREVWPNPWWTRGLPDDV